MLKLNFMILFVTGPESLIKTVADKKWDQVKIVCTQPYNQVIINTL